MAVRANANEGTTEFTIDVMEDLLAEVSAQEARESSARPGQSLILTFVITAVVFASLLVVAPVQYLIFLICGSPVRAALRAGRRMVLLESGLVRPASQADAPSTEDSATVGYWHKPVTATNALAAGLLWVLSKWV